MSMIRQCAVAFGIMLVMQSSLLIGASGSGNFSSLTKDQAQQEFSKKFKQTLMLGDAFSESELDGLIKAGVNINMSINISGKGANQYLVPLVAAAQSGKVDLVKLLLKKGADIAVKNEQGHTAFDVAADEGIGQILQKQAQEKFSEKFKALLQKKSIIDAEKDELKGYLQAGADVNKYTSSTGIEKNTLIESSNSGNADFVRWLLNNKADVSAKDKDGFTALHWAAARGYEAIVQDLLAHGANIEERTNNWFTVLGWAVFSDKKDIVQFLIKQGANINAKDSDGNTPLHIAAQHGYKDIVDLLLANNADTLIQNNQRKTAFDLASSDIQRTLKKWEIQKNFSKKVEEIIKKKDMTEDDKSALQQFLSDKNNKASIDLFLYLDQENGRAVFCKRSTLLFAESSGNEALLQWCFEHGANVDFKGAQGRTLLQFAAFKGNKSFVEKLLNHGANINAQDDNGQTALMLAALKGHQDVVDLLLKKGVNASLKDKKGSTAFNLATDPKIIDMLKKSEVQEKFAKKVLEVLGNHDMTVEDGTELKNYVGAGADVNQPIVDQLTNKLPLVEAIMNNQVNFVQWLVAHGAHINAIVDGASQRTVFMEAVVWGNKEIVKFLLENGADVNVKNNDGKTAFDLALSDEIRQLFQKQPITDLDQLKSALTALKAKLAALAEALEKIQKK